MVNRQGKSRDTRAELRSAAIRLGVRDGIDGASIRVIAREAGVTEGAVYKHFENKDDLIRDAYSSIVLEMARDKATLVRADLPFEAAVRAWIKFTYQYFDGNRDAFTYVLLMPHRMADTLGDPYTIQGELFTELLSNAQKNNEIIDIDHELALTMFSGLVLGVPHKINDGSLKGPAEQYTEAIAAAVLRVFTLAQ